MVLVVLGLVFRVCGILSPASQIRNPRPGIPNPKRSFAGGAETKMHHAARGQAGEV